MATGTALSLLDVMSRHVRVLETSVQAAPMLGLLGTVLGMIAAFNEMSVSGGAVDPTALAGGIWVALSTTALGLTIAIPFYFFTSWIEGRIERERAAMDTAILDDRLRPGSRPGQPGTDRSDRSATRRAANRSAAALSRRMRGIQLRRASKKGMRFMLMPLVDVIFLLLTFFMLSSKLAPYSALMLGDYRREGAVSTATDAAAPQAQPDVILTLSAGEVRANGTTLPLARFPSGGRAAEAGAARKAWSSS